MTFKWALGVKGLCMYIMKLVFCEEKNCIHSLDMDMKKEINFRYWLNLTAKSSANI